MTALQKVQRELLDLTKTPFEHGAMGPTGDDLFIWQATVVAPAASPYRGGQFFIDISIPADYPNKPPKCRLTTKIYHPNVDDKGRIQLALLTADQWRATSTIRQAVQAIYDLLTHPNLAEPIVPEIAQLYKTDRAKFDAKAQEWTRLYAM
ncbi:MAG: ubiquitin-conjugating enzyme family protein [Saprospiraceae bacterium]|nr:ubiquitin-conjugating enzyme family protein [Saprospiraceae bacterium]